MAYPSPSLCSLGPTIWRLVEGFAMSPPLLFVFSESRGLLKAFGDDVEQIRTAAYAYRQHELWSWAVGDIADGMRRWDPNSDAAHPLVCYCDECRRIDGDLDYSMHSDGDSTISLFSIYVGCSGYGVDTKGSTILAAC